MKNLLKATFFAGAAALLSVSAVSAQTKPQRDSTITVSHDGVNRPYKNDAGKIISAKEMFALMGTGDYKIVKAIDKDKKEYWLVKHEPGAGRAQSREFTVTPHKNR